MKIRVSRVRHPLACFSGEINVGGEKTATAEEIKLAFDYFPVIDGQQETASHSAGQIYSNGKKSGETGNTSTEGSSRFVKFNG